MADRIISREEELAIREEERGAIATRINDVIDTLVAQPDLPLLIKHVVVASLMGLQFGLTEHGADLPTEQIASMALKRALGVKIEASDG